MFAKALVLPANEPRISCANENFSRRDGFAANCTKRNERLWRHGAPRHKFMLISSLLRTTTSTRYLPRYGISRFCLPARLQRGKQQEGRHCSGNRLSIR